MEKTPIKAVIIIILCLVVYAGIIFMLFYNKDTKKPDPTPVKPPVVVDKDFLYIVLSPNTFWEYKNGKWQDSEETDVYRKNLFIVYDNESYAGKYHFSYNNKWYLFNDDNEFYDYEVESNIIGLYGDRSYSVLSYQKELATADDLELINKYLLTKGIETSVNKLNPTRVVVDYDNDQIMEVIYIVSNAFDPESDANRAFGYVFTYDDLKFIDIYGYSKKLDDIYNVCSPNIQNIIDLDVDGQAEIIVRCEEFSNGGLCQSMYQYQKGQFSILKKCD